MKRRIFALIMIVLTLFLTSCNKKPAEKNETTSTSTMSTEKPTSWEDGFNTLPPPSIVDSVTPFSVWEGEYPGETEHREIYYGLRQRVVNIVYDYDEVRKWESEEHPAYDDFHEMAVVQFIKRFNIPREEFDKVNQILIDEVKNDPRNSWEPYNADLIYTFDPIKISNYYRQYDEKGNEVRWREIEPWKEMLKQ